MLRIANGRRSEVVTREAHVQPRCQTRRLTTGLLYEQLRLEQRRLPKSRAQPSRDTQYNKLRNKGLDILADAWRFGEARGQSQSK